MREATIGRTVLTLMQGDITAVAADVIVNAANAELIGGGGVDGAIHRAGGPSIMLELNRIRGKGCPTGGAILTKAGNLPAKHVAHAVGPIYRGGGFQEAEDLASAYATSLKLAASVGAKTVSFPSISTGAYGYPVEEAAVVSVAAVAEALRAPACAFERVTFVLFSAGILAAYAQALSKVLNRP